MCPYCRGTIILEYQIMDLIINISLTNPSHFINLRKVFADTQQNRDYIRKLLINSLNKKAFLSRIVFTKPLSDVVDELIKVGILLEEDRQFLRSDIY